MSIKNSVTLIGNLGQDPEIKKLESGTTLAKFSLATSETYKDKNGEKKTDTQWHNIVIFGKLAEIVEKFLKKGSKAAVKGMLTYNNYQDKDGNDRISTQVKVNELQMLDSKKGGDDDLPF